MIINRIRSAILTASVALLLQSCSWLAMPYLTSTRHIARDGDTLNKLAVAYYGSENKVAVLVNANPGLTPLDPISPGTRVEIPVD